MQMKRDKERHADQTCRNLRAGGGSIGTRYDKATFVDVNITV